MAFTIEREPFLWSPSHNDMTYRVLDTDNNIPGFRYIFEIVINTIVVSSTKLYPRPDGYCNFNPQFILRNYVELEFINDIDEIYAMNHNMVEYTINFYTEHQSQTKTLKDTETKYIWYSSFNWFIKKDTVLGIYDELTYSYLGPKLLPEGLTLNILKKTKRVYKIRPKEKRTLTAITTNDSGVTGITSLTVRTDTNKIWTLNHDPADDYITSLPVGIDELNNILPPGIIPGGLTDAITIGEDSRYIVSFNGVSGYITHPIVFEIDDCEYHKWKKYSVLYKSTDGGWWSIPFNLRSFNSQTVSKEMRESILPYNYVDGDRVDKVVSVDSKGVWTLNTDYLKYDEEIEEIMDMVKSSEVFIIHENDDDETVYIPVTVNNGTYQNYSKRNDGLVQYTISFTEAFRKNTL